MTDKSPSKVEIANLQKKAILTDLIYVDFLTLIERMRYAQSHTKEDSCNLERCVKMLRVFHATLHTVLTQPNFDSANVPKVYEKPLESGAVDEGIAIINELLLELSTLVVWSQNHDLRELEPVQNSMCRTFNFIMEKCPMLATSSQAGAKYMNDRILFERFLRFRGWSEGSAAALHNHTKLLLPTVLKSENRCIVISPQKKDKSIPRKYYCFGELDLCRLSPTIDHFIDYIHEFHQRRNSESEPSLIFDIEGNVYHGETKGGNYFAFSFELVLRYFRNMGGVPEARRLWMSKVQSEILRMLEWFVQHEELTGIGEISNKAKSHAMILAQFLKASKFGEALENLKPTDTSQRDHPPSLMLHPAPRQAPVHQQM